MISSRLQISTSSLTAASALSSLQYNDTMAKKIFQVNLTAVILQGGSDLANSPRIEPAARLLEVVIAQPNQSLGELNFNVSGKLEIQEDQGSIQLGVTRTGSLLGQVGFRFVVIPVTSGPDAPADASDYSPRTGQVMFQAGEAYKQLEVNITDDQTAELGEAFMVQMSRPLGGVRIGQRQAVQVVIVANDDPFGLFGYVFLLLLSVIGSGWLCNVSRFSCHAANEWNNLPILPRTVLPLYLLSVLSVTRVR